LSVASKMAEGMERYSEQEKIRFLDIARASTAELITQVYIGIEIGFLEKESGLQMKREAEEIGKMTTSLIKGIKNAQR